MLGVESVLLALVYCLFNTRSMQRVDATSFAASRLAAYARHVLLSWFFDFPLIFGFALMHEVDAIIAHEPPNCMCARNLHTTAWALLVRFAW